MIRYLGDNENLGMNTTVVDTISQTWAKLQSMDERSVKRAQRDQQRVTFFSHLEQFLKEFKTAADNFAEIKKKQEMAEKSRLARLEKQHKATQGLRHKAEKEKENNIMNDVLSLLNTKEGIRAIRQSKGRKTNPGQVIRVSSFTNNNNNLTTSDPSNEIKNQLRMSREARNDVK